MTYSRQLLAFTAAGAIAGTAFWLFLGWPA